MWRTRKLLQIILICLEVSRI
uniref:Uncharacterized protein n=1 Tax=Cryptosporidium parvum TaxID=5807 RepID=F0X650_CRYPV